MPSKLFLKIKQFRYLNTNGQRKLMTFQWGVYSTFVVRIRILFNRYRSQSHCSVIIPLCPLVIFDDAVTLMRKRPLRNYYLLSLLFVSSKYFIISNYFSRFLIAISVCEDEAVIPNHPKFSPPPLVGSCSHIWIWPTSLRTKGIERKRERKTLKRYFLNV